MGKSTIYQSTGHWIWFLYPCLFGVYLSTLSHIIFSYVKKIRIYLSDICINQQGPTSSTFWIKELINNKMATSFILVSDPFIYSKFQPIELGRFLHMIPFMGPIASTELPWNFGWLKWDLNFLFSGIQRILDYIWLVSLNASLTLFAVINTSCYLYFSWPHSFYELLRGITWHWHESLIDVIMLSTYF